MTMKYAFYIVLVLLILPFAATFAQDADESDVAESEDGTLITCGVERWAVKTCYDADTANVNFNNISPAPLLTSVSYSANSPK